MVKYKKKSLFVYTLIIVIIIIQLTCLNANTNDIFLQVNSSIFNAFRIDYDMYPEADVMTSVIIEELSDDVKVKYLLVNSTEVIERKDLIVLDDTRLEYSFVPTLVNSNVEITVIEAYDETLVELTAVDFKDAKGVIFNRRLFYGGSSYREGLFMVGLPFGELFTLRKYYIYDSIYLDKQEIEIDELEKMIVTGNHYVDIETSKTISTVSHNIYSSGDDQIDLVEANISKRTVIEKGSTYRFEWDVDDSVYVSSLVLRHYPDGSFTSDDVGVTTHGGSDFYDIASADGDYTFWFRIDYKPTIQLSSNKPECIKWKIGNDEIYDDGSVYSLANGDPTIIKWIVDEGYYIDGITCKSTYIKESEVFTIDNTLEYYTYDPPFSNYPTSKGFEMDFILLPIEKEVEYSDVRINIPAGGIEIEYPEIEEVSKGIYIVKIIKGESNLLTIRADDNYQIDYIGGIENQEIVYPVSECTLNIVAFEDVEINLESSLSTIDVYKVSDELSDYNIADVTSEVHATEDLKPINHSIVDESEDVIPDTDLSENMIGTKQLIIASICITMVLNIVFLISIIIKK